MQQSRKTAKNSCLHGHLLAVLYATNVHVRRNATRRCDHGSCHRQKFRQTRAVGGRVDAACPEITSHPRRNDDLQNAFKSKCPPLERCDCTTQTVHYVVPYARMNPLHVHGWYRLQSCRRKKLVVNYRHTYCGSYLRTVHAPPRRRQSPHRTPPHASSKMFSRLGVRATQERSGRRKGGNVEREGLSSAPRCRCPRPDVSRRHEGEHVHERPKNMSASRVSDLVCLLSES